MPRRVGMLFATAVLFSFALGARGARTAAVDEDKKGAIDVVLAHELACQTYNFDKLDSLHTPDSRGIEESYPHPSEPEMRESYQAFKDAGVHVDYHPQDAVAEVRGDVAWVTITLHSTWTTDSPKGRDILWGNEWRATFVENFVLTRTLGDWKIALGHSSMLPAYFGVTPDSEKGRGGMKFVKVSENGPAGTAGFKAGDILTEYGKYKIDDYTDYARLHYAYSEGETVKVTVMRGHEKITKDVTLEAMPQN